jgi:hypothetical protein
VVLGPPGLRGMCWEVAPMARALWRPSQARMGFRVKKRAGLDPRVALTAAQAGGGGRGHTQSERERDARVAWAGEGAATHRGACRWGCSAR